MQIVTAANDNKAYPELVKQCTDSAASFGYNTTVYDLGGLGYGNDKFASDDRNAILTCWQKPFVMLDSLEQAESDELVVWVDADVQFKDRIDEIDDKSYHVGLVVRGGFSLKTVVQNDFAQKFNSGVMFLYNNNWAKSFLQDWISTFPRKKNGKLRKPAKSRHSLWAWGDQNYLNGMLRRYYSVTAYNDIIGSQLVGVSIQYKGMTLKVFDAAKYNNYDVERMDSAKLLHYKGGTLREEWVKARA